MRGCTAKNRGSQLTGMLSSKSEISDSCGLSGSRLPTGRVSAGPGWRNGPALVGRAGRGWSEPNGTRRRHRGLSAGARPRAGVEAIPADGDRLHASLDRTAAVGARPGREPGRLSRARGSRPEQRRERPDVVLEREWLAQDQPRPLRHRSHLPRREWLLPPPSRPRYGHQRQRHGPRHRHARRRVCQQGHRRASGPAGPQLGLSSRRRGRGARAHRSDQGRHGHLCRTAPVRASDSDGSHRAG